VHALPVSTSAAQPCMNQIKFGEFLQFEMLVLPAKS
jgi:hypothetical protein